MTLNPKCWLILDFLDFQPDSVRVYIFAVLPQVPGHLAVSLLPRPYSFLIEFELEINLKGGGGLQQEL